MKIFDIYMPYKLSQLYRLFSLQKNWKNSEKWWTTLDDKTFKSEELLAAEPSCLKVSMEILVERGRDTIYRIVVQTQELL